MREPEAFTAEPVEPKEEKQRRDESAMKEVLEGIRRKVERCEERNREHVLEYAEIKRLYRCKPDPSDTRGGRTEPGKIRSRVANPELNRCVESVTSAEDAVAWGEQPNYELSDEELDDALTGPLFHAKTLIDKGHERMGLRNILKDAMRSKNLYGRVTVEVCWKRTWRYVRSEEKTITPGKPLMDADGVTPMVDPATGQPVMGEATETMEVVEREVMVENRPDVKVIPPWRVFMDGECVADSSFVAVRRDLTREQLEEWIMNAQELGMQTRDLTGLTPGDGADAPGDTTRTVSESVQRQVGVQPEGQEVYRCVDYWGPHPTARHPKDPKQRDRRIYRILMVNDSRIVIEGVNPYNHGRLPFLDAREIPEEETAEGLGAGQLLKNAQILLNQSETLLQEMGNFAAYGVWRRQGGGGNLPKAIRIFPSRVLDDEADGLIDRLPMDSKPFQIMAGLNGVRVEGMRAASAATSNAQGLPSGADFAVEVRSIAAESARRLAGMAQRFMDSIYRPLIEMEAELYDQYLPDDTQIVSRVPYEGQMYHVRALKGSLRLLMLRCRIKLATDLDFRKNMSRNMNQAMQQNVQLLNAIQQLAQSLGPNGLPLVTEAFGALIPGLMALSRRQLAINGISPEVIPKDIAGEIQARLKQIEVEAEAMKRAEAEALLASQGAGIPAEGGANVPAVA